MVHELPQRDEGQHEHGLRQDQNHRILSSMQDYSRGTQGRQRRMVWFNSIN